MGKLSDLGGLQQQKAEAKQNNIAYTLAHLTSDRVRWKPSIYFPVSK